MPRNEDERDDLSWQLKLFSLFVRVFRVPIEVGIATAGRLGVRYARLLSLRGIATRAFERSDHEKAVRLARELLALAEQYRDDWSYGNALHHGHLLLGRVALARGDLAGAGAELLEAGRTPGSPQLNSFGPNMTLARELLGSGQTAPVREYFSLCRHFWMPRFAAAKLREWDADVVAGREPRFGPHLRY